jgi:transposase
MFQMNKYSKKLDEEKVMAILADTRSNRQVAKIYGVSHETIGKIKRRESWRHIRSALCNATVATTVVIKH